MVNYCQSGVHPPTRASGGIIVKDLTGVSIKNILQNQKGHHDDPANSTGTVVWWCFFVDMVARTGRLGIQYTLVYYNSYSRSIIDKIEKYPY